MTRAGTLGGVPSSEPNTAPADEDDTLLLAMLLDACHQQSLRETRFPDAGDDGGQARSGRGRRRRESDRKESAAEPEAKGGADAVPQEAAEGSEQTGKKRRRRRSRRSSGSNAAREAAAADAPGQDS